MMLFSSSAPCQCIEKKLLLKYSFVIQRTIVAVMRQFCFNFGGNGRTSNFMSSSSACLLQYVRQCWLRKLASRIRPRVGPGYQDCLHNHVSARLPSSGPGNHPLDDMFVFFPGRLCPRHVACLGGWGRSPPVNQKKSPRV